MTDNGEDCLSLFDRKIWDITYSTLERFGCLSIFKRQDGSCVTKTDTHITFMVPRHHPRAAEVKEYLEHEAKALLFVKRQPDEQGFWYPNTYVKVMYFDGIGHHMDRDVSEEMAADWAKGFMNSLQDIYRKKGD